MISQSQLNLKILLLHRDMTEVALKQLKLEIVNYFIVLIVSSQHCNVCIITKVDSGHCEIFFVPQMFIFIKCKV